MKSILILLFILKQQIICKLDKNNNKSKFTQNRISKFFTFICFSQFLRPNSNCSRFSQNPFIPQKFVNIDNKKHELVIFITEMFSLKLREFLAEQFPGYDFSDVKGDILQSVGPLKLKMSKFVADEAHYI